MTMPLSLHNYTASGDMRTLSSIASTNSLGADSRGLFKISWHLQEETGSQSEGSHSRQTVKYAQESRGTGNKELLCWRGPVSQE